MTSLTKCIYNLQTFPSVKWLVGQPFQAKSTSEADEAKEMQNGKFLAAKVIKVKQSPQWPVGAFVVNPG